MLSKKKTNMYTHKGFTIKIVWLEIKNNGERWSLYLTKSVEGVEKDYPITAMYNEFGNERQAIKCAEDSVDAMLNHGL